ncbi:MAG TPA: hypothetical protein VFJ97_12325 [Dermatophilaceae bacterium]|nr:hypothetical protein [Dermatophilaceae bacterium]
MPDGLFIGVGVRHYAAMHELPKAHDDVTELAKLLPTFRFRAPKK